MKKTLLTTFKIAVSVGLYVYIFSKVDVGHLWSILRDVSLLYFMPAILVYVMVQAISAYRWYLLLSPLDLEVPYPRLLGYYLLGMFFNNFMPTGIGGDVFRIYYLNKETRKLSRSTASVFFDRDLGMAALLLMATVVAAITGTGFKGVPLAPVFGLIALAFLCANLALFYRPTYNVLHRMLLLFRMRKADEKVENLFNSVNAYRGQWKLMFLTILLSLGVQFGCAVVNKFSANALPASQVQVHAISWLHFLVFIPAIGLISMIPVSVNGMGWREYSYIVLFGTVGATPEQAAALAVLWLGVLVTTSIPGAIIYVIRGLRVSEHLPTDGEILEESEPAVAH